MAGLQQPAVAITRETRVNILKSLLAPPRLVGLGLLGTALGFGYASLQLPLWAGAIPGAGLTPLVFSIALLPVALILLAQPVREDEGDGLQAAPLVGAVMLLGLTIGTEYLGFVIPSAVFTFAWAYFFYRRSVMMSLLASGLVPLAFYLVFVVALSVPLRMLPG